MTDETPKRRNRNRMTVASFGPELMAALLTGAKKEVRLSLPYRQAVQFRRRVHDLRSRMREEKHPELRLAERTRVSVLWGPEAGLDEAPGRHTPNGHHLPVDLSTPAVVLLRPYDEEFGKALKDAGINVGIEGVGNTVLDEAAPQDPLAAFNPDPKE